MTPTKEQFPLTGAAEKIVQSAKEIAVKAGHICVGVEHLLVALCEDGSAVKKLRESFVFEAEEVSRKVRMASNVGTSDISTAVLKSKVEKLSPTPRFRLILALASKCARESDRTHIDEGTLFVAILREGDSGSARILVTSGYWYQTVSASLGYKPVTS